MTTHNPLAGSHRQINIQYRWQVITLPTSVLHRHSSDRTYPEVSLLKIYIFASHNCCIFCQTSIAPHLTSTHYFSIPSLTLPTNVEEIRFLLACPHSGSTYSTRPVCIYIFSYQGTMD